MRFVVLVAVALAGIWFGFVGNDWLDRRPVQRLLWLGDSYTYYNDLPAMVASMADSAGSDVRYDIVMHARPSARLEGHWNNAQAQALLAEGGWDKILIQPESYFEVLEAGHPFFRYGTRMLRDRGRTQPVIIASWVADEAHYEGNPVSRDQHLRSIGVNHRGLASRSGARLIDAARVWEDVRAEALPFSLYKDDNNHPSLEGSYLAALIIYAELAQRNVDDVTYVPWGMSDDHANLLRERVQRSLRERRMGAFAVAAPTRI